MTIIANASELAQNDRAAQVYTWSRLRDLRALQADLGPVNAITVDKPAVLGYVTVARTPQGFAIHHRAGIVMAASFVCVQAYILARFW